MKLTYGEIFIFPNIFRRKIINKLKKRALLHLDIIIKIEKIVTSFTSTYECYGKMLNQYLNN